MEVDFFDGDLRKVDEELFCGNVDSVVDTEPSLVFDLTTEVVLLETVFDVGLSVDE